MNKTIKDSVYYDNLIAKFNIDLSKGKKNAQFPMQWQKITDNLTTQDSKNVAIITGRVNNLLVVDIDKPKEGEINGLAYFEENIKPLKKLNTLITKSMNGGYHVYFKYTSKLLNSIRLKDIQIVSIDIKSDGGCIYEGEQYELINDVRELMSVPDEFIKLYKKEEKRKNLENTYCGDFSESIIIQILNNLNSVYYDDYNNWFNVLCVLKNLNCDKEVAFEFSKRSRKFDLNVFNKTWNSIDKRDSPNFGTLMFFLKQSVNKIKYDNIVKKLKEVEKKNDITKTFLQLCKIFYNQYKHEIIVYNINQIYVLNKFGIWEEKHKESKYFLDKIRKFIEYLQKEGIDYNLNEPSKYNIFLNEVLKEFQVENIKWNCNPKLFVFNNGVYDFDTMTFRNGKYDEYINMSCGYDYIYEDSTRARLFYEDFLIDKEKREYYLNIVASHLVDIHQREEFVVKYNKTGQNGKSKENKLLSYVFGNYAYTCKSSLLLCNVDTNPESASPVILGMKNKRMIIYNEIKEGKILDSETIKRLTGGDRINARDLYQSGTEQFYINGCQMMGCNDLPGFDKIDSATIRRLVLILCDTKFVINPVKENERQMKEINVEELKHSMFQLLVEHYNNNVPKEFDMRPNFVKEAVNKYLSYKNDIKRFVRDFIEESKDDYIKRTELKELFKNPSNKVEYNLKRMNYDKFEEEIIDELKTYIKEKHDNGQRNCIIGYKIKDE